MLFHTNEYKRTVTTFTTNDGHTTFINSDYKDSFIERHHPISMLAVEYWPGDEPDRKPVEHSTDLITVYAPQEYTIPTTSNPDGQKVIFRLYKIRTLEEGYRYICETDGPYTCEITSERIYPYNLHSPLREINYLLRSAYRETWATLKALEGTPVDRNQSPEINPVNLKEAPEII